MQLHPFGHARILRTSRGGLSRYALAIAGSRTILGHTADERRARRREALIDAALTITHEDGLAAVGMRRVCAATRLNQRYFYESFSSPDDLLIAVLDEVMREVMITGFTALQAPEIRDKSLFDRALNAFDQTLDVILDDPRKATLVASISAGPEPLQHAYGERIAQLADAVLAEPEAAELGFDETTAVFVAAGTAQVVTAYLSGRLKLDRAALVDKLARLGVGAAGHQSDAGVMRTGTWAGP